MSWSLSGVRGLRELLAETVHAILFFFFLSVIFFYLSSDVHRFKRT